MFKKVRLCVKKLHWFFRLRRYWMLILFVSVMLIVSCDQQGGAQDGFGTLLTETVSVSSMEASKDAGENRDSSESSQENIGDSVSDSADDPRKIYVYVCGLVKNPGVYTLDEGARQIEAIDAAGGMLPQACADSMNLAAIVTDGERIYVPSKDEVSATALYESSESAGLININTATKEELMTLTGIGESKAQRIIEYRESQGGFPDIEALKNVPGIKDGTYDALKDQITVG